VVGTFYLTSMLFVLIGAGAGRPPLRLSILKFLGYTATNC